MNNQIRVLAVDDHPLLREGIAELIGNQEDMVLVAAASNGRDLLVGMEGEPYRFFVSWPRDFITLSARPAQAR